MSFLLSSSFPSYFYSLSHYSFVSSCYWSFIQSVLHSCLLHHTFFLFCPCSFFSLPLLSLILFVIIQHFSLSIILAFFISINSSFCPSSVLHFLQFSYTCLFFSHHSCSCTIITFCLTYRSFFLILHIFPLFINSK